MGSAKRHAVGDRVHVYAFHGWRSGVVTEIDGDRVRVEFARGQHGETAVREFLPQEVFPAAGLKLVRAGDLRPGDVVMVGQQEWTVAEVAAGPRRRVAVRYAHGDSTLLPEASRLRVATCGDGAYR